MKRLLQLFSLLSVFGLLMFVLCFVRVDYLPAEKNATEKPQSISMTVGDFRVSVPQGVMNGMREGFSVLRRFADGVPCYISGPVREAADAVREVFAALQKLSAEKSDRADAVLV